MNRARYGWIAGLVAVAACGGQTDNGGTAEAEYEGSSELSVVAEAPFKTAAEPADHLIVEDESHLASIRQITFGGQNAEAYWSTDDEWIMFQATPRDATCDQQYSMRPDGSDLSLISTGTGRTTCGYFFPGNEKILY